jgi:hypothetical protein
MTFLIVFKTRMKFNRKNKNKYETGIINMSSVFIFYEV